MGEILMQKPAALRPGDTIGVIAPASGVTDRSTLIRGLRYLEKQGYTVRVGAATWPGPCKYGYLAASDLARAADLQTMFTEPNVRAIFCARGGYGCLRLLPYLDWELLAEHPKIFLGFSDITTLHLAFNQELGLVTFHGPMVASNMADGLTPYTERHFWPVLTGQWSSWRVESPPHLPPPICIVPGEAQGPLTGGNLSLVAASLGTPWEIETEGKILLLEEVEEEPYKVDRLLMQLRLAGKLSQAAGIVFGRSETVRPRPYQPSFSSTYSLEEVLFSLLGDLKRPSLYGLPLGHGGEKATIPLGVRAHLHADAGYLEILEPGVNVAAPTNKAYK